MNFFQLGYPLEWKGRTIRKNDVHFYRLSDDPHLMHLMDIPAKKYLFYNPVTNSWKPAKISELEKLEKAQRTIIYRVEDSDPCICEGMEMVLDSVHEEVFAQNVSDSEGNSTGKDGLEDEVEEVVPSSQCTLEFEL